MTDDPRSYGKEMKLPLDVILIFGSNGNLTEVIKAAGKIQRSSSIDQGRHDMNEKWKAGANCSGWGHEATAS